MGSRYGSAEIATAGVRDRAIALRLGNVGDGEVRQFYRDLHGAKWWYQPGQYGFWNGLGNGRERQPGHWRSAIAFLNENLSTRPMTGAYSPSRTGALVTHTQRQIEIAPAAGISGIAVAAPTGTKSSNGN
jgi:hypothetical protein